ncbi:Choline transport protein [Pleurostoma richardsiae]|uniref:Choline transport protein n=1 Tax=Pleurostoma richardsiae TaxID=41990 RepID=A0AA38RK48_9PEZI|nr:Choline transport protein [Pleurostoma richardsiae]
MERTGPDKKPSNEASTDQRSIRSGDVALEKRISIASALGVAYSATCAPIAILIFLSLTIGIGGSPVFIYAYIIYSGQIFWSAQFAPEGRASMFSYVSGFFAVCCWIFWYISAPLLTAQLIMATVEVAYPGFAAKEWHVYVIYLGILVSTYLWNIPLFSTLERINRATVALINIGSIYIFITLLVRASPKESSRTVWLDIQDNNGWSTGVNFIISFLPGLNCVSGFDSAAHLSEEMYQPHRSVPIVMISSAGLSLVTGFIMAVVSAYCTTNAANLLDPVGGQPGIQLMKDSFGSLPLTIVGSIIFVLVLNNAATCLMTVSSRMIWAMARQKGIPFSSFLGALGSRTSLPHNATLASVVIAAVIGALQLGSSVVVSAILGSAIICCNISYAVAVVLLMAAKSRNDALGKPWFSLGRWGFAINATAVFWLALSSVALCFPSYRPVTVSNMNFASIAVAVVAVLGVINWFVLSRKAYIVPAATL